MKSSNILMMGVLMIGMGSNLFAKPAKLPTITNTSNEILTITFYDMNNKPLSLVNANNDCDVPGQLDYNSVSMNIPAEAKSVSAKSQNIISSTIDPKKSYFIMGRDKNNKEPNKPWSIVDADTYVTIADKYAYQS